MKYDEKKMSGGYTSLGSKWDYDQPTSPGGKKGEPKINYPSLEIPMMASMGKVGDDFDADIKGRITGMRMKDDGSSCMTIEVTAIRTPEQ